MHRLYLKYLRNVADKTDFGRMAGPSLLRLVDEAMSLTNSTNLFNGNRSADIWNSVETMLEVSTPSPHFLLPPFLCKSIKILPR